MSTALTLKIVIAAALGLGTVLFILHGNLQQPPVPPPPPPHGTSALENYQMNERQKAMNQSMQTVIVRPDARMK